MDSTLFGIGFGLGYIGLVLGTLVLWVMAIVDVLKNEFKGQNSKIIWLLVLVFLGPIGLFLYYFIGKSQKLPATVTS